VVGGSASIKRKTNMVQREGSSWHAFKEDNWVCIDRKSLSLWGFYMPQTPLALISKVDPS
jgi:hypothetical protein